jgi:hypothetical protein
LVEREILWSSNTNLFSDCCFGKDSWTVEHLNLVIVKIIIIEPVKSPRRPSAGRHPSCSREPSRRLYPTPAQRKFISLV